MSLEPTPEAPVGPHVVRRASLREAMEAGEFVLTAEVMPPKGPEVGRFLEKASLLKDYVHAVNVTDCSRAVLRMSSLASSSLLHQVGIAPIFQLTCRDRNSLALQADLLGAAGLGIENVLALTGDGVRHGDHPGASAVFEVEAIGLLRMIRTLNKGKACSGKALNGPAGLFSGAVVNPNFLPGKGHRKRFARKAEAGARFFQTQMLTNFEAFASFMKFARPLGVPVFGGVLIIKSLRNAIFLNEKVPGVRIGDDILRRFEAHDGVETGVAIAAEQVRACKELCEGVHLMALGREDLIIDVLASAGL